MSAPDIRPYRLTVPDQAIADLRERLRRTRWPDDYLDHDWDFGTDQTYLKALCAYWAGGYDCFGAQGGDFGASVTVWLARDHGDKLTGFHLNMMPSSLRPTPDALAARPPSDAEKQLLADGAVFVEREGGYSHIQRTKPQT